MRRAGGGLRAGGSLGAGIGLGVGLLAGIGLGGGISLGVGIGHGSGGLAKIGSDDIIVPGMANVSHLTLNYPLMLIQKEL